MSYKTTMAIRDLQDDDFCYYAGAIYPRPGIVVSQERLDELVEKRAIAPLGALSAISTPVRSARVTSFMPARRPPARLPTSSRLRLAMSSLWLLVSSQTQRLA